MSVYRWLAHDLLTNVALGDLPLQNVVYGAALNSPATLTADLPLGKTTSTLLNACTIPERTALYVERDGDLVDGFVIWTRRRRGNGLAALQCASFDSFFNRQRIIATLSYTGLDQFTIARNIYTHIQSQAGANIGLVVGSSTSGIVRDRTYNAYERKNAGGAVDDLSKCENGYDYWISVGLDGRGDQRGH